MVTWLRIIVSCFCLVLCILFAALWVRSYYYLEMIMVSVASPPFAQERTSLVVENGTTKLQKFSPENIVRSNKQWRWSSSESIRAPNARRARAQLELFGFRWNYRTAGAAFMFELHIPFWFPVTTAGLIAYVAKPKPRWRFGLHELLVLSTVGAITVGALAIFLRAIA